MNFLFPKWMKCSRIILDNVCGKNFIDFRDKMKLFFVRTIFRVLFCQNSKRKEILWGKSKPTSTLTVRIGDVWMAPSGAEWVNQTAHINCPNGSLEDIYWTNLVFERVFENAGMNKWKRNNTWNFSSLLNFGFEIEFEVKKKLSTLVDSLRFYRSLFLKTNINILRKKEETHFVSITVNVNAIKCHRFSCGSLVCVSDVCVCEVSPFHVWKFDSTHTHHSRMPKYLHVECTANQLKQIQDGRHTKNSRR